jgi:hypothetical protein
MSSASGASRQEQGGPGSLYCAAGA